MRRGGGLRGVEVEGVPGYGEGVGGAGGVGGAVRGYCELELARADVAPWGAGFRIEKIRYGERWGFTGTDCVGDDGDGEMHEWRDGRRGVGKVAMRDWWCHCSVWITWD